MALLPPDAVLVRNGRLSWRVIDEEAVILFPDAGTLHRLNGTGTRAWELLDGRSSIEGVSASLAGEFDVALAQAIADVQELATELIAAGLAEVVTS